MRLPALGDFYATMRKQFVVQSHFEDDVITTGKLTTASDTNDFAVGTAANGILSGTTAATDNDHSRAHTTAQVRMKQGACITFATDVAFEDAATDDGNLLVGISDEHGTDQMQDDGAGIDSDMHGAGFYAIDGSDVLGVFYSDGTDQVTNLLTKAASLTNSEVSATYVDGNGDPKYRMLEVEIKCKTSSTCDVVWRVDGTPVYQLNDQAYTADTDVHGLWFIKAGSANAQTLSVRSFVYAATFDDPA